jgi:hypothetical protein
MNDETESSTPVQIAKPKKTRQRRKRSAPKKPFVAPAEFAGLTATTCCTNCREDRCVISGTGVCAHPHKGGLQPALMGNQQTLATYARARKALAHQTIDLRS